jgi:hypothetical protein
MFILVLFSVPKLSTILQLTYLSLVLACIFLPLAL